MDDSPLDVELTIEAFSEIALENDVLRVRDGAEALDYLRRAGRYCGRTGEQPEVILLDCEMPSMTGLEVLREIKSDAELKSLPVVMLTASSDPQHLVRSYELGVNSFVLKPVGYDEFVTAIRHIGAYWLATNCCHPADLEP